LSQNLSAQDASHFEAEEDIMICDEIGSSNPGHEEEEDNENSEMISV
jgi:hypothetical protein